MQITRDRRGELQGAVRSGHPTYIRTKALVLLNLAEGGSVIEGLRSFAALGVSVSTAISAGGIVGIARASRARTETEGRSGRSASVAKAIWSVAHALDAGKPGASGAVVEGVQSVWSA